MLRSEKTDQLKPQTLIFLFLAITTSSVGQGQWLCPWEQRQEIQIKEKSNSNLTDYQVKIEVPFTTGMNTDYSDIRFTLEDGTSLLSYYIETYNATRAIVWLKIPIIAAKDKISYYLYFCNPSATSASDPDNTFIFFDDFHTLSGWTAVGGGTVVQNNSTFPGTSTLKKDGNCDPAGAFKSIGQTLNSFRMITREHRKNEGGGCTLNRYGLEGNGFNGYGIKRSAIANPNGAFGFERRNNGNGQSPQQSTLAQPFDNWFRIELTRCYEDVENLDDDRTNAILYNDDKVSIGNHAGSDGSNTQFDKVVVRGGRPYYFDFIAVGKFTCSEPEINFKKIEINEPEIICQDVTISLDENGMVTFDPELAIASAVDCNTLTYIADETHFDCNDIGTKNIKITATDGHANATSCQTKLTIEDNLAPIFSCPADITVTANLSGCSSVAFWSTPNVVDNCPSGVSLSSTHNSGDIFSVGATTVTYTATDDQNNVSNCSFEVTIISDASVPNILLEESSGITDNDGIICEGDVFCLTADTGYANYDWSSGASTNSFCGTTGGSYDVTVTSPTGCMATSTQTTITSNDLPQAGTCNIVNDYCMENIGSVQLQASSGSAPYMVSWTPTINGVGSGAINNSGEFININNIPGGTTINFSVVDQNGCTTD